MSGAVDDAVGVERQQRVDVGGRRRRRSGSRPTSSPTSTPSFAALCTQQPASSSSGWSRTPSIAARPTPPVAHWITRYVTAPSCRIMRSLIGRRSVEPRMRGNGNTCVAGTVRRERLIATAHESPGTCGAAAVVVVVHAVRSAPVAAGVILAQLAGEAAGTRHVGIAVGSEPHHRVQDHHLEELEAHDSVGDEVRRCRRHPRTAAAGRWPCRPGPAASGSKRSWSSSHSAGSRSRRMQLGAGGSRRSRASRGRRRPYG